MNYKETYYFIARSLTSSNTEKNFKWVESQIKEKTVNWEHVVQVSTANYVLPALYSNLKKCKLLPFLPSDLVKYMGYITELNRERNLAIIEQAKELNSFLKSHSIQPVFIKGTASIVQGLYHDVAERMVGDIDFIVPIEQYQASYDLLKTQGYIRVNKTKYDHPNYNYKHQPRLCHSSKIAAVEVHKELLDKKKYNLEFNYKKISKSSFETENGFLVMGYRDQLALSIMANQINDYGQYFKKISLRNAYDVLLFSQKTDAVKALEGYSKLFNPLNNCISTCNIIFGNLRQLSHTPTRASKAYYKQFDRLMSHPLYNRLHYKFVGGFLWLRGYLVTISKAFYKRDYTVHLLKRLTDLEWLKGKLIKN
ncbi:MAG: nucleotidyltransferase family protein [Flavobacteriaceae bacterium]|tara:strand:+ start:585 stop:1682 length:1098 start_codon:yes stop_codon:yes gene_type:complete